MLSAGGHEKDWFLALRDRAVDAGGWQRDTGTSEGGFALTVLWNQGTEEGY